MPLALLSVSDKSELVPFARGLHSLGWHILASGGTARALDEGGLPVTRVEDHTGSPEILGGRVKTLHPVIAGGLLARETAADANDLEHIGARPIELVAVNLYPFQETIDKPGTDLEDAIESIDIGGVTLIRAAAKNFQRVTVLVDPDDYAACLQGLQASGRTDQALRRRLAEKAFQHTAAYEAAIAAYLGGADSHNLQLFKTQDLRYGENPHQSAALYAFSLGDGPLGGSLRQGKALSYNNLLDLDAAWRTVASFEKPTVCIVKHVSPCGVASAESLAEAYPAALASDPVSAFGGVIAVNRTFEGEIAGALGELFIECIAAPSFSAAALETLSAKKNLRLVEIPQGRQAGGSEWRSITSGLLRQSADFGDPESSEWQCVTQRQPTEEEWLALRFAWKTCQHVKSNAIVFARGEATVGIGGGQPNRVDCVRIAADRAGAKARGAVMASDAFFPFPDSVEQAASHGITAIVQPGGSRRDELSIRACNQHEIAMVFTGVRHFRH